MNKRGILSSAAVCAVAITGAPAWALDASDSTTVEGVEVTGRRDLNAPAHGSRLDLTPLETPASIEVIAGDTVRERGDLSIGDAVSRATGVTNIGSPGDGGGALSARGFSGLGSVMQLYDGMRLYVAAGTITFPFDPWTVDRIEVLRGPASVMYGEGAIGGAVNVVPKRPDPTRRSFDYQVGYGTDNTARVGLGAGGPINDYLAYRVDGSYNRSDGWVDRGDSQSLALSGALRFQATPDLVFTLSDDYGDQHPQRYFGTPLIGGVLRGETTERNYNVADSKLRYEDNWLQFKTEWTPSESFGLRNVLYHLTSQREWRNAETYDWISGTRSIDRVDYIAIVHDLEQTGDRVELTLNAPIAGLRNRLVVGAETNSIRFTHTNNGFVGGDVVDAFNPTPGSFFASSVAPTPRYHTETDQYAIFAEDQLHLTERLSVVAGVRYDSSDFERVNLLTRARFAKSFEHTDWRIGAVYQPDPGLSFYAQYSTGSDPLGSLVTTSQAQTAFDLATGRQYEAGVKQLFADGLGQWTLAVYDIVKKNLLTQDPNNPTRQVQVGERSSRGVEGTVSYIPAPNWSVDANVAMLKPRFDDFVDGGVSYAGKTPANLPKVTANLWVNWRFRPDWQARAGLRHVGGTYSDNAEQFSLPAYTVVDLGLDWTVGPDTTVSMRVTNVTDEVYPAVSYGDEQWILGRPRAFEIALRGRF